MASGQENSSRSRTAFFVSIAVVLTATVFFGFTRTFFLQPFFGAPALSAPFILHGVLGTSWFVLLVYQAWLAKNGRIAEHRRWGSLAPWLVLAIIATTFWVMMINLRLPVTGSGLPRHAGFLLQASTTLWFVGLFIFGWSKRNRPDVHKRAMILATIAMMAPGFSRISSLFRDGGPPPFDSAYTAAIFIGALAVYDMRALKRIHPVTLWAGLGYLGWVTVRQPVAKSDAWAAFAVPLLSG